MNTERYRCTSLSTACHSECRGDFVGTPVSAHAVRVSDTRQDIS